jgi:hypothetical protein
MSKMKKENLGKIQAKLDLMTRKRWFFLFFILLQFVPPYASKGYELPEWGFVVGDIMRHGFIFSCSQLYPIFKVIPIILIISIIFLKNKVVRAFSIYGGITYILFAFLQLIGISEKYGLGIMVSTLIMFLIVATFWFWEVIAKENDFTPRKKPAWKYWVAPLAFLAFWFPLTPDTLMLDFNPAYLVTNSAGLAFCMMTPVYLAILSLYYQRVNMVTLRVTSLVGVIIAFYNMLNFLSPKGWWLGILHIPLLTISIFCLVISLRKKPLEETK